MPQIINENPSIGSLLGTGLGQGISSGLQQLAHLKTQQLLTRHQQRQSARGYESLGFSPQEASQISLLPQELQGLVLKNYLQSSENAGLEQALRGIQVNPESPSEDTSLQDLLVGSQQPQQPQLQNQALFKQFGIQPSVIGAQLPSEKVISNLMAQQTPSTQTPSAQVQKEVHKITKEPVKQEKEYQEARHNLAEVLKRPRLTPEHRLKVEALKQQKELAQQKITAKEQEEVNKETKPVYDAIQKSAKAAKENNVRLDEMEKLISTGNLPSPTWASIVKAFGHGIFGASLDLSASLGPEGQEFEKLSSDFVKSAKDYFGSRLTDADLKAFLRTVPSLSQSREGKRRVMKNLRMFNEVELARKRASDKVLQANGGKRPRNYEQLVEDISKPEVDRIANEFKATAVPKDNQIGFFVAG